MKPSPKSPAMQSALDSMSKNFFGRSRTEAIENDVCVDCGNPAKDFRDKISEREYTISGLCQKCQDRVFGKE
jgi:hypothetical protein